MRYDKISFIFVISKVDLVGIESNNASIDQLKPGNFGPQKPQNKMLNYPSNFYVLFLYNFLTCLGHDCPILIQLS